MIAVISPLYSSSEGKMDDAKVTVTGKIDDAKIKVAGYLAVQK